MANEEEEEGKENGTTTHRIVLHVYEVSDRVEEKEVNANTVSLSHGSKLWLSGLVAFRREYLYSKSGIESCRPGETIFGVPKTTETLGYTEISYGVFLEYILALSESNFSDTKFNLVHKNSNHFCQELSQFLCGVNLPNFIPLSIVEQESPFLSQVLQAESFVKPNSSGVTLFAKTAQTGSTEHKISRNKREDREDSPEYIELQKQIEALRVDQEEIRQRREREAAQEEERHHCQKRHRSKKAKKEKGKRKKKERRSVSASASDLSEKILSGRALREPAARKFSAADEHLLSRSALDTLESKLLNGVKDCKVKRVSFSDIATDIVDHLDHCNHLNQEGSGAERAGSTKEVAQPSSILLNSGTGVNSDSGELPGALSSDCAKKVVVGKGSFYLTELSDQEVTPPLVPDKAVSPPAPVRYTGARRKIVKVNSPVIQPDSVAKEGNMADSDPNTAGASNADESRGAGDGGEGSERPKKNQKPSEPPVTFREFDHTADFEDLVRTIVTLITPEEQDRLREMEDWLIKNEGTWVLSEGFNTFLGRVMHDRDTLPSEGRVALLRLMAYAAGQDDFVLILHSDRKDHLVMNYAQEIDRLPVKEQEGVALLFANMFETTSSSEWLLYISEWSNESGPDLSNIRVTTKVAVNALLGDTPALQDYGSAIMHNLGTKEVKAVVFDDVCTELTMAILQFFQGKPPEEQVFRCLRALSKFCTIAHREVPQLIKMIGPEPAKFSGMSPRVDELVELIGVKVARVANF